MVQKGKFSAGAALWVSTLKNVDLPTLGTPTMPMRRLVPMRPIRGLRSGSSCFLGGISTVFCYPGIPQSICCYCCAIYIYIYSTYILFVCVRVFYFAIFGHNSSVRHNLNAAFALTCLSLCLPACWLSLQSSTAKMKLLYHFVVVIIEMLHYYLHLYCCSAGPQEIHKQIAARLLTGDHLVERKSEGERMRKQLSAQRRLR